MEISWRFHDTASFATRRYPFSHLIELIYCHQYVLSIQKFVILQPFSTQDNLKTFREAEKDEILDSEVNHNFEADMYLEKLEQDNEKVTLWFYL